MLFTIESIWILFAQPQFNIFQIMHYQVDHVITFHVLFAWFQRLHIDLIVWVAQMQFKTCARSF